MATKNVNLGSAGHFKVKEGSYHKMLGIPEDEKIPKEQEEKDAHSSNPARRRKAISALGFRAMHHGK